jgi:glucokinase
MGQTPWNTSPVFSFLEIVDLEILAKHIRCATLSTPMRTAIAIDFGGTNLKGAIIREDGTILEREQRPTGSANGADVVLANLVQLIADLRAKAPESIGVGLGVPAPINHRDGVAVTFPNVSLPDNFPIREYISQHCDLPVVVHNDANAAVLGEAWIGAAHGVTDVLMLTLGTGIGGGVISNSVLIQGADGLGAELGHMRLRMDGPMCGAGVAGCLEALASAPAVVRMAQERIDATITDSREVYDRAKMGDTYALEIWKEIGVLLGVAIGNYINIFNPRIVLLGGNMSHALEFILPSLTETAKASCYAALFDACSITRAKLGNDAGIFGAAHSVFTSV